MRGPAVRPVAVGDVGVVALGVELPAVERAPDLAVLDLAAVAEVGAEVGAERVHHVGLVAGVAPGHEVTVEVVERPRAAPSARSAGSQTWNQPYGMENG